MKYRQSLIGFHNPHEHKDLTPEEFLILYKDKVLLSRSRKKDGAKRVRLADWIDDHWEDQLKFVARLFPQTLKRP